VPIERLTRLEAGQRIPFGGDRVTVVPSELASSFRPGDRLVVVQESGDLLHVPGEVAELVEAAVADAVTAFRRLATIGADRVDRFFADFAARLADDATFDSVKRANDVDVDDARARGRAIGRLTLSDKMRSDMISALHMWRDLAPPLASSTETIDHGDWTVEERRSPLGVVGFVFEGRPNVFADATGVLKSGNSVVFRIGSDALGTARAIMESCVRPALEAADLPSGSVVLVDSPARSAGHALFADSRLALAVARGSGEAVAQLGAVARQSGVPVSLHGTGGAWIHVAEDADPSRVADVIEASLDRKVCNTVNVVAIPLGSDSLHSAVVDGIERAATRRDVRAVVHLSEADRAALSPGGVLQPVDLVIHADDGFLATEWEWDDVPEVSIVLVPHVERTLDLFDRHSPHFVMSVLTEDQRLVEYVYASCEAPFVGDGFTRWVDGQYALGRPELGLSNWQNGRLFGRGGILSGDGVFSVRHRTHHGDSKQRR
jgi:glutamate-5-semialdehyde dehydrogenase